MWNAPAYTPRDWLDYLNDTLDVLCLEGASAPRIMSLGMHLRIIGRPGRIAALEQFLDRVQTRDDVWVTTREDIVYHWTERFPVEEN